MMDFVLVVVFAVRKTETDLERSHEFRLLHRGAETETRQSAVRGQISQGGHHR
jgi:hypothetical protein